MLLVLAIFFPNQGLFTMNRSNISASVWESPVPPVLQFVFGVLGSFMALLILVCNSPSHRWHPFYKLVAGLALTDGGGILLLYPPILTRYATNFTFNLGSFLCGYTSFLASFTILSSALIVCAMSIDRCVAVYRPFYYKSEYGDRRRVVAVIGAIWAVGGLVSSLHLAGLGSVYKFYPGSWCFLNFISGTTLERVNSLIYSGLGILVLLITVTLNFSVIVATLHKKHRAHLGRLRKDVYNIVFLSAIVLISSICWAPLMVRSLGFITRLNSCSYL